MPDPEPADPKPADPEVRWVNGDGRDHGPCWAWCGKCRACSALWPCPAVQAAGEDSRDA